MYLKTILMLVVILTLASGARAQTKISGTEQCGAAGPVYTVPVGARPNHDFWIGKGKCTFTKTFEIGGIAAESEEITFFGEQTGNRARGRGLGVGTVANEDKYFVSFKFLEIYQGEKLQSSEVTWAYTGGSGKLKGLKGKGTTHCKGNADGGETCDFEGEYQLPK